MGSNRRPGLTSRVIRGLRTALSHADAGMPENLTGYDDAESNGLYDDVRAAIRWLDALEDVRNAARRRGRPTSR